MASDYGRIRDDNILEYGKGIRHLEFFGKLYSDKTHFIYELLQNAEDAGATRVNFSLTAERLEMRHDGRLFNEMDVRGVCGVGEGTKADDLTQIGKFGIGFKSVYAYTLSPEIHSGNEHFRIEHYVRPVAADPVEAGNPWTTLFFLPFNRSDISVQTAFQDIAGRLENIGVRTLLFLRNINQIEWNTKEGADGFYLRETRKNLGNTRWVTVIGQKNQREEEEDWLIFDRPLGITEGNAKVKIEIAFRLVREDGTDSQIIRRVKSSPLVVFFSTETETKLGFLLQGPFRTTLSRDLIPKEDDWNKKLIEEAADLISQALPRLRDLGYLNVSLLEALPITLDDFPRDGMFSPFAAAVRQTLAEQPLLPADDGSYVSTSQAKLAGSAELRELLGQTQLKALLGADQPVHWLSKEITERGTPELWKYLRNELEIEEIDADYFARRITEDFLKEQDDEWMIRFYAFLAGQRALWRPQTNRESLGILRNKPIIRLSDNSHTTPFRYDDGREEPCAYLPAPEEPGIESEFPLVKESLTEDEQARKFFHELSIPHADIVSEAIDNILPKYGSSSSTIPPSYQKDVNFILKALKTDSVIQRQRLEGKLKSAFWVMAENAESGAKALRKPGEIYFRSDDLETYFGGNPSAWFLSHDLDNLATILESLGISRHVRVQHRIPNYTGHVILEHSHGRHERGLSGFDPETNIDGLLFAVSNPLLTRSKFIWNSLLIPHKKLLKGFVEEATRQDYSNSEKYAKFSKAGLVVVDHAWIFSIQDTLNKPAELYFNDLPEGYVKDEELAKQIGMKIPLSQDSVSSLANALGIDVDDIEYLKNNREKFKEFKRLNESKYEAKRPKADSYDRGRRDDIISEEIITAPPIERKERSRTIRVSKPSLRPEIREYLRDVNTNEYDELICQFCH